MLDGRDGVRVTLPQDAVAKLYRVVKLTSLAAQFLLELLEKVRINVKIQYENTVDLHSIINRSPAY